MANSLSRISGLTLILHSLFIILVATASAGGLPSAVMPHEYALPLTGPDKKIQAVTLYFAEDYVGKSYNSNGDEISAPTTTRSYSMTQRYYQLFQFEALPSIGFGWQAFLSEVRSETKNNATGARTISQGLGDPTLSGAAWIKPTNNSTLSYLFYIDMPFGSAGVSRDYYRFRNTIGYDIQLGELNIDGAATVVFNTNKTTAKVSTDLEPGTIFNHSLRLAYRFWGAFEPFVGYDFQATGPTKFAESGSTVVGSQYEHGITGGLEVKIPGGHKLGLKYEQGIAGKNTSVTETLHFKYSYMF